MFSEHPPFSFTSPHSLRPRTPFPDTLALHDIARTLQKSSVDPRASRGGENVPGYVCHDREILQVAYLAKNVWGGTSEGAGYRLETSLPKSDSGGGAWASRAPLGVRTAMAEL